ncbi:unnamed protein product [Mytilus edulis]|uniref:Meiosis 1 arrest protein n=1 Tax=Mytilus edulis TaxID=6550 RepID=A0A8S3UPD8_MYTED|nr:unnamed protein product [Mytilus edulis]
MAGNMKKIEGTRMLLGKQPARMLLVDTSYPLLTFRELVNDLCQTLENVFSVATNIGGPSRMPFFSLMSLGSYPELHLPLSHVKNNYSRIQTSITDLYDGIQDKGQSQIEGRGCIVQGIQEACAHFHRQMKTMVPQTGGLCNQLEIILMTCQQGQKVQKQIDEAIMLMNLENVKRIQVVVFNVGIDYPTCEESDIVGSQNSLLSNISNNSSLSGGLVEVVNLDPDALSLQNFFNTWLLDSSTDSEHLHIILPALQTDEKSVVIKCDLRERILNPAQLPFYGNFTVHPDSATMKTFPSTSKALGMSIPIYRIKILGLLSSQDLCDSIVYGMPMIALATNCWKIDWDDLEKNQQLFKALCYKLVEKDQVIIGELENPVSNRSRSYLLPCQTGTSLDGATEESLDLISSSLHQIEEFDSYNPLMASSGLYQCLKNKNKRPEPKQQKRKTENNTNREVLTSSSKYNTNIQMAGKAPRASPVSTSVKRLRPLLNIFPTDL